MTTPRKLNPRDVSALIRHFNNALGGCKPAGRTTLLTVQVAQRVRTLGYQWPLHPETLAEVQAGLDDDLHLVANPSTGAVELAWK